MSVRKQRAAMSQSIDVWCLRIRMRLQTSDPVVEIVNRDEQNVRPLR